jgi:hypothetical protein
MLARIVDMSLSSFVLALELQMGLRKDLPMLRILFVSQRTHPNQQRLPRLQWTQGHTVDVDANLSARAMQTL